MIIYNIFSNTLFNLKWIFLRPWVFSIPVIQADHKSFYFEKMRTGSRDELTAASLTLWRTVCTHPGAVRTEPDSVLPESVTVRPKLN